LEEKDRNFFCTDDKITIVDILYYNDIIQILVIEGQEAFAEFQDPSRYGKLLEWFKRVKKSFSDKQKASGHQGESIIDILDKKY